MAYLPTDINAVDRALLQNIIQVHIVADHPGTFFIPMSSIDCWGFLGVRRRRRVFGRYVVARGEGGPLSRLHNPEGGSLP